MKKEILFIICILTSGYSFASKKNKKEKLLTFTKIELQKEISKRFLEKLKKIKEKGVVQFSNELMEKEQKLFQEKVVLDRELKKFEMTKRDFITQISKFKEKQNKLIGCMDKIDQQRAKRIRHMVDTVASMKPITAAKLLSVQDSDLSVQILGKLPSAKVSKIFNLMKGEISARLQKQYMNMQK